MDDIAKFFPRGVYILSPEGLLTHNAGCIMEGLIDLNVPVHTNATQITSRHVSMPMNSRDLNEFVSEPHRNFSAYIVDITHNNTFFPLDGIDDRPVAYLTTSDSSMFCDVPEEFLLFSTHANRFADKGGNRRPIAFGPTNWLLARTAAQPEYADRDGRILHNFRPTLSQGVRAMLDISFVPLLAARMQIDRTIYASKEYLGALMSASAVLTYGGDFYSPIMNSEWFAKNQKDVHELHSFSRLDRDALILRWDSWRFWESLVAGCTTIHLDFEKYGFELPVQPEAWTHYLPVDLDNVSASADALWDRRAEWKNIAEAGRAWAIEHYAPKPTAKRVLTELAKVLP